jgi:hypothetical protein
MLRADPAQRRRLEEIIRNLTDRIDEARANGWLGEVQGLQAAPRPHATSSPRSIDWPETGPVPRSTSACRSFPGSADERIAQHRKTATH